MINIRSASDILKDNGFSIVGDRERWRWVVGYEGLYEVSSDGRIRSVDRFTKQRGPSGSYDRFWKGGNISGGADGGGYMFFVASTIHGQKNIKFHIAVAEAFLGPRPDGMVVCHNNGDNKDNRLCNLRYDTPLGNSADSIKHGVTRYGDRHQNCKVPDEFIPTIEAKKMSVGEIVERFGVSRKHASSLRCGNERSKRVK